MTNTIENTIKVSELPNFLRQYESKVIKITTLTLPNFAKGGTKGRPTFKEATNRDADKFVKLTIANVLIGTNVNYRDLLIDSIATSAANNTLETDIEFDGITENKRTWGEKVDNIELTHNGQSYIICHFFNNNDTEVYYVYDGTVTELTDIEKSYLTTINVPKSQSCYGLNEKTQVIHRDYKCSSFYSIEIDNVTYKLIKD